MKCGDIFIKALTGFYGKTAEIPPGVNPELTKPQVDRRPLHGF
nr:MAG TPA: hypothetical protein [Caudoviricetes sp.]